MGEETQIRIVTLNDGDHLDTVILRFKQGWHVHFVLGDNLLGKSVRLLTSLSGEEPLPWSAADNALDSQATVICSAAGSYSYEFFVNGCETRSGSGYFLVDPELSVNGTPLHLDSIVCQTHLAKLLGPLTEWESRLRVAKESGYNMLHLTPIHSLGVSNSSYSIKDHHALNETLHSGEQKATFDDVSALVSRVESEWGMLTVQDVVWNHAAKNAPWLLEHPESAYNCQNSPHLRPAYILDRVLHHFGKQIAEGKWTERGIPPTVNSEQHLQTIEHWLRTEVLPAARLHDFFQIDIEAAVARFTEEAKKGPRGDSLDELLPLIPDPEYRRLGASVDFEKALRIFNRQRGDAQSEEERVSKCSEAFRSHVKYLNEEGKKKGEEVEGAAIQATLGHIRYERVAGHGPRVPRVDTKHPLTCDYFLHTWPEGDSLESEECLAFSPSTSPLIMAFNGWVMSADPLANFALSSSTVYLKRELVCWGDSVKLNYGDRPDPNNFLWHYMLQYTEKCAALFHGVRIDNAHGTPIHVAEYLLSAARRVRPNLFVFAELFTGSEHLDNMFVNRLGITSLIREAQAAGDSHEQGRLVYRYGGDVVGAMRQRATRLSSPQVAHAFFLDQSHDNPSPIQIRSALDLLPTAAMVSMASCAAGSTRGYDELVPHAIDVVKETRLYPRWGEQTTADTGIMRARALLNTLHAKLAADGFSQVFVDQMSPDVVGITRHSPTTHESVVLIAHTAFNHGSKEAGELRWIPISGQLEEIIFEMKMKEQKVQAETMDETVLAGLKQWTVEVKEAVPPPQSTFCRVHGGNNGHIQLVDFPSGAVVAFRFRLDEKQRTAVQRMRIVANGVDAGSNQAVDAALSGLTLQDLQRVLFTCNEEEGATVGHGAYHIPNYGEPVYCGLQGLMPILQQIRENNDLGHPLCGNLREGLWLADYVHGRLRRYAKLSQLASVFECVLAPLAELPFYLRPCYFEALLSYLYKRTKAKTLALLNPETQSSDSFVHSLALSSISFASHIPGASLPPLPPTLTLPDEHPSTLSAGLPHFSTGIWRNWGRDTFIALPGCYLATGRFDDAKATILGYAGTLRHGLIPNLLAEGVGSRFNCRDAVWFWLHAIKRYTEEAPDGKSILREKVRRIYPKDDTVFGEEEKGESLWQTMYEALQKHWRGINFRERNAGPSIDEQMQDEGFNMRVWVDRETGLVHGGNAWNCGTWMDKMGSSEKAGNKGEPATARDGAAVELQALAHSALKAAEKWKEDGVVEENGVDADDGAISWGEWAHRIQTHFESLFYVDENAQHEFINRRCIVKDTVGSTAGYTDFQLRCNFAIALAVAPTLVDANKAWKALDSAKECLLGPIGIKTLDPKDWAYDGFYNNDDDGTNKKTAKGWNYHQGPEWVWVACFYLRARLCIGRALGGASLVAAEREVQSRLGAYRLALKASPWRSLPELTQAGGLPCPHSCHAQAWSIGVLLEVCQDIHRLHK